MKDNTSEVNAVQNGACPMIAWIMPVYNGEKYIRQAIESILLQPCKDCEVWVMDDGSTDATAQIVKGISDDRVHYIYQENAGVSAARNNGIRSSCSKYVAFLDADDVMCTDAYDGEIYGILEEGKYDILSFSYYHGNEDLKRGMQRPVQPGEYLCSELTLEGFRQLGSYLFQRSAVISPGSDEPFPEGIRVSEDLVFLFLALRRGKRFRSFGRDWMVYRKNPVSVMNSHSSLDYLIDEEVQAWYWCKKRCTSKEDIALCDNWILVSVINYIHGNTLAKTPVEDTIQKIKSSPFPETWQNYDALWRGNITTYEEYIADPKAYSRSLWKDRMIQSVLKVLVHFPRLRDALRGWKDISGLVYPTCR